MTMNTTLGNISTVEEDEVELLRADDAIFVLGNSIVILTMQSGFGLLECGCVSFKSAANIMFKNSVDIIFGTIAFWSYGWGLAFGTPSTGFCSYGQFFFIPSWIKNNKQLGSQYVSFFFQSTFASTATTIVSGSIAERAHMHAYVLFSSVNMLAYVIPASWVWGSNGFLLKLGFYDFAGGQVVHANGGFMALYVAWLIGPRLGVFDTIDVPGMSSPVTALSGTFILWFAWFGFNCGTTFSVAGNRWKLAALVANNTLNGSAAGGATAIILSLIIHKKHYHIAWLINGILGGLVGITSNCSIIEPHESLFIGSVGAMVSIGTCYLVEKLKIDDPVSAFAVHGACGFWGSIATGIFGHNVITDELTYQGLAYSKSFYLLGVQLLGVILIASWSIMTSAVLLKIISFKFAIRLSQMDEILGPDIVEHMMKPSSVTFIEGQSSNEMVRVPGQQALSRPMSVMSRNESRLALSRTQSRLSSLSHEDHVWSKSVMSFRAQTEMASNILSRLSQQDADQKSTTTATTGLGSIGTGDEQEVKGNDTFRKGIDMVVKKSRQRRIQETRNAARKSKERKMTEHHTQDIENAVSQWSKPPDVARPKLRSIINEEVLVNREINVEAATVESETENEPDVIAREVDDDIEEEQDQMAKTVDDILSIV